MFSGCYFSDNLHQHADGNITLIISVDDNNSWDYLQEKVAETVKRYPEYKIVKYNVTESSFADDVICIYFEKDNEKNN